MKEGRILFLNEAECKRLLPLPKVLELMETVLIEHAEGTATLPVKLHMGLRPDYNGYINSMPSYLKKHHVYGVKLAGCHYENPKKGLPTSIGTINLYNPENGLPFAIMDGTYITDIRTGAMAGVAAKFLSGPAPQVLTIVGAGMQGRTASLSILASCPTIQEVRLIEINPTMLSVYMQTVGKAYPNVNFRHLQDIQQACTGAQIVHVAHSAPKPLVRDITFDKGATVILTAEPFIARQWLDTFDTRVTDFPECLVTRLNQEAEYYSQRDGLPYDPLTPDFSDVTIGEVVAGKHPGRKTPDEVIVAVFVGMSIEDVICAKEVYDRAVEQGFGTELRLLDL